MSNGSRTPAVSFIHSVDNACGQLARPRRRLLRHDGGMSTPGNEPDSTDGDAPSAHSWSPGALWPTVRIALGIVVVVVGLLEGDPVALILTGLLALFLIPSGALQLLRRPRIEVVDGDLALRKVGGVHFLPRTDVVEVRALGMSRWGIRHYLMRVEYLDEQGREQLEVFTRADLGTDPRDVVETLERLGFGPSEAPRS